LAITLGIFTLAVITLDYIGVFAISYDGIVELISKLFDPAQAVEVLTPLIANLPLGVVISFTAGFRVVLGVFLILSLLSIIKNLLQAINFLSERAEDPVILPEFP